jgi:Domain of unknown function (DUF4184)
MPFTLSHAAAVLPALRTDGTGTARGRGPLLAAGLVAGSLAPDVPSFADSLLPGADRLGRLTHHPVGVLTLDPLIAAALAAGWIAVRGPVTALLPPGVRDRAARLLDAGPAGPGAAGSAPAASAAGWWWASAAAGAATHVAWDAFTHRGRWGVRRFPALDRRVGGVPLHHWAQYGSSVAGLAALARWTSTALRTAPPAPPGPPAVLPLTAPQRRLCTAALTASAVAGGAHRWLRDRPDGLTGLIAAASFGGGAALTLATAAYAGAVHARSRTRRPG